MVGFVSQSAPFYSGTSDIGWATWSHGPRVFPPIGRAALPLPSDDTRGIVAVYPNWRFHSMLIPVLIFGGLSCLLAIAGTVWDSIGLLVGAFAAYGALAICTAFVEPSIAIAEAGVLGFWTILLIGAIRA